MRIKLLLMLALMASFVLFCSKDDDPSNPAGPGSDPGGNGGGIYVESSAEFRSGRLSRDCWNQDQCNRFVGNNTGDVNGFGGAIYNNGGTVEVFLSFFGLTFNKRAAWPST